MEKSIVCPSGKSICANLERAALSSLCAKNIPLPFFGKLCHFSAHPASSEGRTRGRHET
jgi:hypothetical protein